MPKLDVAFFPAVNKNRVFNENFKTRDQDPVAGVGVSGLVSRHELGCPHSSLESLGSLTVLAPDSGFL